jgi:hypothetical protein
VNQIGNISIKNHYKKTLETLSIDIITRDICRKITDNIGLFSMSMYRHNYFHVLYEYRIRNADD